MKFNKFHFIYKIKYKRFSIKLALNVNCDAHTHITFCQAQETEKLKAF